MFASVMGQHTVTRGRVRESVRESERECVCVCYRQAHLE